MYTPSAEKGAMPQFRFKFWVSDWNPVPNPESSTRTQPWSVGWCSSNVESRDGFDSATCHGRVGQRRGVDPRQAIDFLKGLYVFRL